MDNKIIESYSDEDIDDIIRDRFLFLLKIVSIFIMILTFNDIHNFNRYFVTGIVSYYSITTYSFHKIGRGKWGAIFIIVLLVYCIVLPFEENKTLVNVTDILIIIIMTWSIYIYKEYRISNIKNVEDGSWHWTIIKYMLKIIGLIAWVSAFNIMGNNNLYEINLPFKIFIVIILILSYLTFNPLVISSEEITHRVYSLIRNKNKRKEIIKEYYWPVYYYLIVFVTIILLVIVL